MELEYLKRVALYIKDHSQNSDCSYSKNNLENIQSILNDGSCSKNSQKCCQLCKCVNNSHGCVESRCVQQCLQLLEQLKNYITQKDIIQSKDSVQTNILSIAHSQYMSVFLHFVIKLGLSRNFDFKLPSLAAIDNSKTQCYMFDLYEITISILSSLNCEEIRTILLSKYLLEVLGALIQLSYSPISRKSLQKLHRHKCLSLLTDVMTKHAHLTEVVQCLLTVQGSHTRQNPTWLTSACGSLLSKCLLLPNGVPCIISAMSASFDGSLSDWKKSELISSILSTPPLSSKSFEDYFKIICPQLIRLLQIDIGKDAQQVLHQIAASSVLEISHKHSEMAEKYIFNQILSPLQYKAGEAFQSTEAREYISIGNCIEILHVVFATFKHKHREEVLIKFLLPYFYILFGIYKDIRNSIDHVVTYVDTLLHKCLQTQSPPEASQLILTACGSIPTKNKELFIWNHNSKAVFNGSGELVFEATYSENSVDQILEGQDNNVEAFTKFLRNKKEFLPPVFLTLIQNLSDIGERDGNHSCRLLSTEDKTISHLLESRPHLITLALITSLCENNDPSDLVDDVKQICSFVETIVLRSIGKAKESKIEAINEEGLNTCFAILALCLLNDLTAGEHKALQSLVPLLQEISDLPSLSQCVKETASDLSIAISTRSSRFDKKLFSDSFKKQKESFDKMKQRNTKGSGNPTEKMPKERSSLIEEISSCSLENEFSSSSTIKQTSATMNSVTPMREKHKVHSLTTDISRQSLDEFVDAIHDSDPAARAAAFRFLSKAAKQKSEHLKEKVDSLFTILIEQLGIETESYVYLSIMQSIVDLVNFSPWIKENSKSESNLCSLFNAYSSLLLSQNKDENSEVKCLKLGEVVMRIITTMGDLAPYYSKKLIPDIFIGMQDLKPLIRASCFSNLSEILPLVIHDISTYEQELCACICGAIRTDNDVTVRRAAVHLVRTLVEKLGPDIMQALPNTMNSYYKVLKEVYVKDHDNTVQLHSQLAIEALDKTMREVIFGDKGFKKKIVVLPP